jgi:hypothetical protein
VYRTVTASTTLASGIGTTPSPSRNACMLVFTNANAAVQTAVFTGDDDEDVTLSLAALSSSAPLFGNFKTVGALGTNVTCVAGWLKNPTD